MQQMNFFIISAVGRWADKKLLGLTPTARALFQARTAGAVKVTILVPPGAKATSPKGAPVDVKLEFVTLTESPRDIAGLADSLAEKTTGPVLLMDSNAIFQRDFAGIAVTRTGNTAFFATGRTVAAIRTDSGDFTTESIEDRATDIDTPTRLKAAKKMLYRGLRKPLLVNGLVAAYLQRPMAHVVTMLIVNTPIRPNHVTLFAMLVGVSGAVLVAMAGARPWMMQLGLLMYFLGSVFDCVDGDLARLKHQGSYIGSWLDTIADDVSTASILIALGLYQAQMTGLFGWAIFGAGAALVFMLGEFYIYYHLVKIYHSGDVLDFQWASGVKKRASAESIVDYVILFFKRDFFTLALLVLGLFQVVHAGLIWLAVLMYLFGGYVLVDIFLSLRNRGWRTRSPD
jgi:phosphatidylglycerophosphate synthase